MVLFVVAELLCFSPNEIKILSQKNHDERKVRRIERQSGDGKPGKKRENSVHHRVVTFEFEGAEARLALSKMFCLVHSGTLLELPRRKKNPLIVLGFSFY